MEVKTAAKGLIFGCLAALPCCVLHQVHPVFEGPNYRVAWTASSFILSEFLSGALDAGLVAWAACPYSALRCFFPCGTAAKGRSRPWRPARVRLVPTFLSWIVSVGFKPNYSDPPCWPPDDLDGPGRRRRVLAEKAWNTGA